MESPRRGPGRPKLNPGERRRHIAGTRLNDTENNALDEALAVAGVTQSDILRRLLLGWAAEQTGRQLTTVP